MTVVKIVAIFFAFAYLYALRFLDGEVARSFVQFNSAVLIGTIACRLFGDLYYISAEVGERKPRFRLNPLDLALPFAAGAACVLVNQPILGIPPLIAGVAIAAHCFSTIGARYLQRTGAPRAAFSLISIPYFQLGSPFAVLAGGYSYDALMAWALIHFGLVAGLIALRRVCEIDWTWRLDLRTRIQQSAGVLSGAIINQGGLFLISITASAAMVADLALFYRLSSFWTFQSQTYNMDRQIGIIDARRTLQYRTLMRDYFRYLFASKLIGIAIVTMQIAILCYFLWMIRDVAVILLITGYFLLNVIVGPIIFFSVMVLERGAAVAGIVAVAAIVAFTLVSYGLISGALGLLLSYSLLCAALIALIRHEGRFSESSRDA